MSDQTFAIGDTITLRGWRGETHTGRIVSIVHPEEGVPGTRFVGGPYVCDGYSGGYCHEHRRRAPRYPDDGATIAPTLPHYTILMPDRRALERCACEVVTDSKPVELW